MHISLRQVSLSACAALLLMLLGPSALAQSAGAAGTVQGKVVDQTGAVVPGATIELLNPVTGYQRTQTSDASGGFMFRNVPLNPYHLSVRAKGFDTAAQDVDVRSGVPIDLSLQLGIAKSSTTVEVSASAGDLLESEPSAHTDVD